MLRDDEWLPLSSVGCGKLSYSTRKEARRTSRRLTRGHNGRMRAYRCTYCRRWHMGHLTDLVRNGQLTQSEYYQMAKKGGLPMPEQRTVDMSQGILRPREVAVMFGVEIKTTLEWARAFQADGPGRGRLEAFKTMGGHWRFGRAAALAALRGHDNG